MPRHVPRTQVRGRAEATALRVAPWTGPGGAFGRCEPQPTRISPRRFVDAKLFERLFLRSVALCREHGLIDGTHLSVDGFHVEANAALASLRASLATVAADAPAPEAVDDDAADRHGDGEDLAGSAEPPPQLRLVEPRTGPAPKRRSSNATSASLTDPDAKLRHKPGQRPHLVHRGQVAVGICIRHRGRIAVRSRVAACVRECHGRRIAGARRDDRSAQRAIRARRGGGRRSAEVGDPGDQ